jgi:hypothetical protein
MSTASGARVIERKGLRGFTIEWEEPNRTFLSRRDQLFRCAALDGPIETVARFPAFRALGLAARLRPAQRALRFCYYNVMPLPDGSLFLTFDKSVALAREGVAAPLRGLHRPTRVLRGGCALSDHGDVYFGEYVINDGRQSISLYCLPRGSSALQVVRTFAPGEIRHIHGVYRDPVDGSLWMTTGDRGAENRILRSVDGFRTFDTIGTGDESWRCVSLQFTEDAIYYGTDAEFTQNFIYRVDRASGAREIATPVEGPIYYSAKRGDSLFFAVTAELCASQQGRFAALWRVSPTGAERMATFDKDRLHRWHFMPGTLDLPSGPGLPGVMHFHTTAVVPDDRVYAVIL